MLLNERSGFCRSHLLLCRLKKEKTTTCSINTLVIVERFPERFPGSVPVPCTLLAGLVCLTALREQTGTLTEGSGA